MNKLIANLILIFLVSSTAFAQRTISGKVSSKGEVLGMEGVTVQVKGQPNATITDYEGNFKISAVDNDILVFTKDGFDTQEISVGSRSVLDVMLLKPAQQNSEKEISVGYGSQTREEMTSSVSQISSKSLGSQPVVDLEQANQGRASGVLVQNSGGKLGQGTAVRIRGGSSLSGSNEPLYVVDGVPLSSGNQSDIDPSTIASMEVLKDASAAAIYGSRAANGVVLITTKKGEKGKLKVDLEYQFGISQTPKKLDMMSAEDYQLLVFEFFVRSAASSTGSTADELITPDNLRSWYDEVVNYFDSNPNEETYSFSFPNNDVAVFPRGYPAFRYIYDTDWQDQIFRNGASNKLNVNLSGGSEKHQVFAGINYLNQEGMLIGNQYERFGSRVNIVSAFSTKFNSNLSIGYTKTNNNRLNEDADSGNPMQVILLPPGDEPDPDNNLYPRVRSTEYNPLTEIKYSNNFEGSNQFNGNLSLTYDVSDAFNINLDGGLDYLDLREERRQGPQTEDGGTTGRSQLTTTNLFNYITNLYASYDQSFGNGALNAMVGTSYQKSNTDFDYKLARINSISELEKMNESDALLFNPPIPSSASSFLSFYSRINYSINSKYVFQLSGRADGSSKFGENNRFGFFPAASLGWNISNESFLADNSVVSFLKLKASYGIVGNTPDDDFLYRRNYFSIFLGDDSEGIRLSNLANKNLKWESTAQLDVGVDYGLWNDRFSGSISYYSKNTSDLLFPVPVSQTSGFTNVLRNVGTMVNSGIEFSISSLNVDNGDLQWTTDFNISTNHNEITDLGGQQLIQGVNAFIKGQPAGVFYMPEYLGVDELTGQPKYTGENNRITFDYDDALANSRQIVGDPVPDYFGGLANNITYKDFDLSFLFQFVQGIDIYWETGELIANSGYGLYAQTADQVDRWYNRTSTGANPVHNPTIATSNPSSRWLVDGSYIRLNNVTLTYSLPADFTSRLKARYLRVYIGGQNLITFSDYPGYNPDVGYVDPEGGAISANINRGIDFFTAPQPRIFTTGIKIGF